MPNPDGTYTYNDFKEMCIAGGVTDMILIDLGYSCYEAILSGDNDKINKTQDEYNMYVWQRNNWRLN